MPYANLTTILIQQKETIDGTELKINNTSSSPITFSLEINKYNENLTTVYIDGTLYEEITSTKSISITLTSGVHTIIISGDQYFNFAQNIIGTDYQQYLSSAKLKITYDTIKERTFENCSNLTNVNLGNDIRTIGSYCFEGCSSLTSLTLPDSVKNFGSYLCSNCTSLTYLKLSNSLLVINGNLIENCNNLTSITIPDSVVNIGTSAFKGPHGLTSITIPANVTNIGIRAFSTSSNLTSVKIKATTPPKTGSFIFEDCTNLTKIYVPAGTLSTYQTATNWTGYANIMEEYND